MTDATFWLKHGTKFPYDEGQEAGDWAHVAARGVIANLSDRRGVGDELGDVDPDVRVELVATLAEIIRMAKDAATV